MDVLKSRRFWAVVVAIVVMGVAQYVPDFRIDQERGAALLVVFSSYVIALGVDPGPGGWAGVFKSRKFWAALVGLVVIVLDGFHVKLPIPENMMVEFAAGIGALIAGFALDKNQPPAPDPVPDVDPNAPPEALSAMYGKVKDEP